MSYNKEASAVLTLSNWWKGTHFANKDAQIQFMIRSIRYPLQFSSPFNDMHTTWNSLQWKTMLEKVYIRTQTISSIPLQRITTYWITNNAIFRPTPSKCLKVMDQKEFYLQIHASSSEKLEYKKYSCFAYPFLIFNAISCTNIDATMFNKNSSQLKNHQGIAVPCL